MDEKIINRDWELSERINALARHYLLEGNTVEEAMQKVLHSEEYRDWIAIPRCFSIDPEQKRYYQDIEADITWKKYTARIDHYIHSYFTGSSSTKPIESGEYDQIFMGLGMQITPEQLGYEIAELSRMVGVNKPLNYGHLLCLYNGTLLSDLEEEQLDSLVSRKEEVVQFVDDVYARYRMK